MVSISMAVLAVFAVSTIAVIVLCRRAPIREDLGGNPVNAWTQPQGALSPSHGRTVAYDGDSSPVHQLRFDLEVARLVTPPASHRF